jgi:O-antigen/teichoic acid export membrane protein
VRKVVEQGGRIAFALLVFWLGFGVVGVTFSMAAAAAVAAVAVGYTLYRSLPRGGKTEKSSPRAVFAFAWPQAIGNFANQIWAVAILVILSRSTDARTVALFGAAFAVSQLPLLVYNAFVYRFSPAIARLWDRGENEALDQLLRSVTRWVAMFALPLYAVAIALPGPLLQIYGSNYRAAALAVTLMTIATLLNALAGPVENGLKMTGFVKLEMATNVVSTVLIVGVAAVLTPRYGLTGAAVSVLLYTIVRNVAKTYLLYRRVHMTALSVSLLRPVLAATVASILVVVINQYTSLGSSLLGTAALGTLLVVSYAFILLRVVGISSVDRRTLRLAFRPVGLSDSIVS